MPSAKPPTIPNKMEAAQIIARVVAKYLPSAIGRDMKSATAALEIIGALMLAGWHVTLKEDTHAGDRCPRCETFELWSSDEIEFGVCERCMEDAEDKSDE